MKSIFFFLMLIYLSSCSSNNSKEYVNDEFKFIINYPSEWILNENLELKNSVLFSIYKNPKNAQGDNLTLSTGGIDKSPDDFYESSIKQMLLMYPDVDILEQDKLVINGIQCYTTILALVINERSIKFKQYLLINNLTCFYFTFTSTPESFDFNHNEFENIVKSFKLF